MLCADVNVVVNLVNSDSADHHAVRQWFDSHRARAEALLIPDGVALSFVRIVTDRRIIPRPLRSEQAFAFLDALLAQPRVHLVHGTAAIHDRFRQICLQQALVGNDMPDAWLAALCSEMDATLVTADKGFHRFPGLRVLDPAA